MAKPLDFLHKNNNENEWAKRYVANKMGMQTGGSVMPWKQKAQNAIRDMRMGWLAKKDPQLRAYLDDTGIEIGKKQLLEVKVLANLLKTMKVL